MSTLLAFIAFAQEEVHTEAETSKTLFYVVGGVLAVWAVLVAGMGIRQHEFPRSESAARGVMGISALLVVATLASALITN